MRKILTFLMIFAATISCIFMFNIVLCALIPEYKNLLSSAVSDDEIPVVTVEEIPEVTEDINLDKTKETEEKPEDYYKITYINNEPVATDAEPSMDKPAIVNKEYHEDCGTGKGYWVITYEDGTIEIE